MKSLSWLLLFLSVSAFANDHTCISIAQDFAHISKAKDKGLYRHANPVDEKQRATFNYSAEQSFSDYINYAKRHINQLNPLASMPCPIPSKLPHLQGSNNTIADVIAPFELKRSNSKKVVLMIHGLTDSPYSFHDLANDFYRRNFSVRTLLLPGHGTAANELMEVTYQDWQQAANYAIERSIADFDEVYLAGFSTGGALLLDNLMYKSSVSEKIKGLLLWSPASKAKSSLAWLAGLVDYVPFVDWIDKSADIDFAKYESFPYNAGAQVHALMNRLNVKKHRKKLKSHPIPLFVVAPEQDQTIATDATLTLLNFWQQNNSAKTHLVYYGERTTLTAKLGDNMSLYLPQCGGNGCLQSPIMAHTAVTNAPHNPHYGRHGSYRNCEHYIGDEKRFNECKTKDNVPASEITENALAQNTIKRLTYNPYYKNMLIQLDAFLEL